MRDENDVRNLYEKCKSELWIEWNEPERWKLIGKFEVLKWVLENDN